jgi:hypothetical protein
MRRAEADQSFDAPDCGFGKLDLPRKLVSHDDAKAKHGLTTTTDRDWAAAGRCCMMGRLGKG